MSKEYWITNSRFKLIVIILVMMWIILLTFFYFKAEEVSKNPCQICARKMGSEIACYSYDSSGSSLIYYPNYSVEHKDYIYTPDE